MLTVVIMSLVFRYGVKGVGSGYEEWLISGYIVWQYMSSGLINGSISIVERSYLVKQMNFEVEVLPVVKILSEMVLHVVIVLVVVIIRWGLGEEPEGKNLQLIYYLIAGSGLTYGLSMLSSSLTVFSRDIVQVVNMVMQICFWGTPIFWRVEMLPEEYRYIEELNPYYYVVEGYRQSILGSGYFWEDPAAMMRYWVVTLVIMWIGRRVFKGLRPHFADVL